MKSITGQPGQSTTEAVEAAIHHPEAFERLYLAFVVPVYRYIYSRTGNRHDAEDLTTQTFMRAMQSLRSLRDRTQFRPWLFAIASNQIRDHYRRNERQTECQDEMTVAEVPDPLSAIVKREEQARLDSLLIGLEEEERELLRLRFLAEMSFAEMAGMVGKSEQAVKKSVYRLLDRLLVRWEKQDE